MSFMINFLDIIKINGVDGYILTKQDGTTVSHNVTNPGDVSAAVSDIGCLCLEMKATTGFSSFRYLTMDWESDSRLIVIPMGQYFVGVMAVSTNDIPELTGRVLTFLRAIIADQKKS